MLNRGSTVYVITSFSPFKDCMNHSKVFSDYDSAIRCWRDHLLFIVETYKEILKEKEGYYKYTISELKLTDYEIILFLKFITVSLTSFINRAENASLAIFYSESYIE